MHHMPWKATAYSDAMWEGKTVEARVAFFRQFERRNAIYYIDSFRELLRATPEDTAQARRHYDLVLELLDAPTIVNA